MDNQLLTGFFVHVLLCILSHMCKITEPHCMKNQHYIRPAAKYPLFLVISHVPGGGVLL